MVGRFPDRVSPPPDAASLLIAASVTSCAYHQIPRRQIPRYVGAVRAAALVLVVLAVAVHGYSDDDEVEVTAQGSIARSDGGVECVPSGNIVPATLVNDGYCDCADGSDEDAAGTCPRCYFAIWHFEGPCC